MREQGWPDSPLPSCRRKLKKGAPRTERHYLYWLIPQLLGAACTLYLVVWSGGFSYSNWFATFSLGIGICYALAVAAGHVLAPRIRYSWLVVLIVPAILVLGAYCSFWAPIIFIN